MKLSCLPVSLYEDIFNGEKSVLDWVHLGADLGLDGIDVSVKFFPTREKQLLELSRVQLHGIYFANLRLKCSVSSEECLMPKHQLK